MFPWCRLLPRLTGRNLKGDCSQGGPPLGWPPAQNYHSTTAGPGSGGGPGGNASAMLRQGCDGSHCPAAGYAESMSAHPPGGPRWHGPDPSAPLTPAWPREEPAANLFSAARLAAVKPPRRHGAGLVAVLVLSALLLAGVGIWLGLVLGTETLFVVGLLALFPLGVCLAALRWIDRWDPEPRLALLFAFAWGAGASIAGSLIFGEAFGKAFAALAAATGPDLFGAVVQAPVVEETMKGLGVL